MKQSKFIKIKIGPLELTAELYDTPTAETIHHSLPINGSVNRWGQEIYFSIGQEIDLEDDATEVVQKGELGYWPVGRAFCIFWGKTPASINVEPRAASPVNVFGKVLDDLDMLDKVSPSTEIRIESV